MITRRRIREQIARCNEVQETKFTVKFIGKKARLYNDGEVVSNDGLHTRDYIIMLGRAFLEGMEYERKRKE